MPSRWRRSQDAISRRRRIFLLISDCSHQKWEFLMAIWLQSHKCESSTPVWSFVWRSVREAVVKRGLKPISSEGRSNVFPDFDKRFCFTTCTSSLASSQQASRTENIKMFLFDWIMGLFARLGLRNRKARILLLGLDNAGKTTLMCYFYERILLVDSSFFQTQADFWDSAGIHSHSESEIGDLCVFLELPCHCQILSTDTWKHRIHCLGSWRPRSCAGTVVWLFLWSRCSSVCCWFFWRCQTSRGSKGLINRIFFNATLFYQPKRGNSFLFRLAVIFLYFI